MSNVINFSLFKKLKLEKDIEKLPFISSEDLFNKYLNFRNSIKDNYMNVEFVLWGEALEEEIEDRSLSNDFEKKLNVYNSYKE